MNIKALFALFAFLFSGPFAMAGVKVVAPANVPQEQRTTLGLYFTARQAYTFVSAHEKNTLFIDVRDPAELQTVGMPTDVDANVPFKRIDLSKWNPKKGQFAMTTNPKFAMDVNRRLKSKGLDKKDPVVVICGSGKRAAKAANALAKVGYTKVYIVLNGYKTWQADKLPWSRRMSIKKMYGNPVVAGAK